jgi:hypothetical protein
MRASKLTETISTCLMAALLLLALGGCSESQSKAGTPPSEHRSTSRADVDASKMTGTFQSQGTTTVGTVTVATDTSGKATVTLSDFSTGPGTDLRLDLNTGTLTRQSTGIWIVESGSQFEIGNVDPSEQTQTFPLPEPQTVLPQIHSVTIFDYANRIAFGSAALTAG